MGSDPTFSVLPANLSLISEVVVGRKSTRGRKTKQNLFLVKKKKCILTFFLYHGQSNSEKKMN